MEPDQPPPPPPGGRKMRFQPKARKAKQQPPVKQPKTEEAKSTKEDAEAEEKLRKRLAALDTLRKNRNRAENRSPVRAAFIHGPKQESALRASSSRTDGSHTGSGDSEFKNFDVGGKLPADAFYASEYDEEESPENKPYEEPWDYDNSYYPNCLPWRRPYSGDPEILDEAEFGEDSRDSEYDENSIRSPDELGFKDWDQTSENVRLLSIKLPSALPLTKRASTAKGKEKVGTSVGAGNTSDRCIRLEELPAGQMGKLLVYKSGAMKLRLGDILYDVSPGSSGTVSRQLVVVNTKQKECCVIGDLRDRAVVTPDIGLLLDSVVDLDD